MARPTDGSVVLVPSPQSYASQARRLLNDGEPKLMYLGPADELDGVSRHRVVTVPISCSSEGALEVFMEPVLPQPHVVVVGSSPAVGNLARLLVAMEWRATVVTEDKAIDIPSSVSVVHGVEHFSEIGVDDATFVVVATQGHYDEPALEAALATEAPYIGLVSSAGRAKTVLGYLRDQGFDDSQVGRVDAPAGIDLGHIEHREIAVAILAKLVQLRAAGGVGVAAEPVSADPTAAPVTAVDPVCHMEVDVATAKFTAEVDGETFYFCSAGCKSTFEKTPAAFLG